VRESIATRWAVRPLRSIRAIAARRPVAIGTIRTGRPLGPAGMNRSLGPIRTVGLRRAAWRFGLNRRSGLIGAVASVRAPAAAMTLALLAGGGAFGRNGSRRGDAFVDGRNGIGGC
jgi:hypothetical protein